MSAVSGRTELIPALVFEPVGRRGLRQRAPRRASRSARPQPYLVPAITTPQRYALAATAIAWFVGVAVFAPWWLSAGHSTTAVALVVNTAVIGVEFVLLPAWFFFFILRMRKPDPELPLPALRSAIVVTKAPSEPWPVVRKTLRAMLAQDHPDPYDVWLADEDPTAEVRDWCAKHGVQISTRRGVGEYHRPTWPRRTKCKEGNLAYFYDHYGYDRYDVVAQLDADHVPEPSYLRRMLAPFLDPEVGYVAAPSICDSNAEGSWSARGRLFCEAVLHGPSQAGCSGEWAPSCIGSHYAVRTSALREIGGLGPELAEDFSTTLLMNAGGWRGTFALDAIAHGDGPECVADCVRQDFQWARSMTNILLRITPKHWHNLTPKAKFKLGFCQLWYPLNGLTMLAMVLVPVWSLATHEPLMRVTLPGFYVHALPAAAAGIAAMLWCRRAGLLRPVDGNPIRWEALLFQFVRWPWALIGVLQAVAGALTGHEFAFAVTPKGAAGSRRLPTIVVMPYLVLAMISLLPALLIGDAGAANGYYFWSLANGVLYLGIAIVVIVLHARENPVPARRRKLTPGFVTKGAAVGTVAAAVVAATGLHGGQALAVLTGSSPWTPPIPAGMAASLPNFAPAPGWLVPSTELARPYPAPRMARTRLQLGVTTTSLADSVVLPWGASALREVNAFEWEIHAHAKFVMWYVDWKHDLLTLQRLRAIAAVGSTPEITWEPWDALGRLYKAQPAYSMARIADGAYDSYIRSFALRMREFGKPVLLRFAQEMNGGWYPWSSGTPTQLNTPAAFIAAWRHVHDIFTSLGVKNVRWVWSPITGRSFANVYPGNRYVDILGVSGFNGGASLHWGGWKSFDALFGRTLSGLHQLAPDKPVQISEVASAEAGGNKATWIAQMFRRVRRLPYVTSLLWFDDNKQTTWPIESSAAAMSAFASGVRTVDGRHH